MGRAWQTIEPVERVYVLPRCSVILYADAGSGVLGAEQWRAKSLEDLRIRESFDQVKEYQTGIPYPTVRHLGENHEISFDSVWNVAAKMVRNTSYILDVTFRDASLGTSTNGYVRRFYYGVTTSSRDIGSRDGNEFASSNSLSANYYNEIEGSNSSQAGGSWTEEADGGTYSPDPTRAGDETC